MELTTIVDLVRGDDAVWSSDAEIRVMRDGESVLIESVTLAPDGAVEIKLVATATEEE